VLLARIYENYGENLLAEDLYRAAIKVDRYEEEAHSNLAEMLEHQGRREEAESIRREQKETYESAEKHSRIDESIAPTIEELNDLGLRTWGSCSGLEEDHEDKEPMAPYVAFEANRPHAYHHLITIADMAGWTADYGVNGWGMELDFENEDQYERELAWKRLVEAAHTVMHRVTKHYGDLFAYLEKRCNLREENGRSVWDCKNDLSFTKELCDKYGLDFNVVKKRLEDTGGYCDCEVLMNSTESIPDDEVIELRWLDDDIH
jgi:tetratricopeptide (TPR) repeat protein